MPLRLLAAVCVMLLAGCGTFSAQPKTASVSVSWALVENPEQICKQLGATAKPGLVIKGCAHFALDHSWCVIYTAQETSNAILGHELRHCFEGHFHD